MRIKPLLKNINRPASIAIAPSRERVTALTPRTNGKHIWERGGKKYHPAYAHEMIELMAAEGVTLKSVCGYFRITWDNFQRWREQHPDFAEAVAVGVNAAHLHGDRLCGQGPMLGKDFNHIAATHLMFNRFGWIQAPASVNGGGGASDEHPSSANVILTDAERAYVAARAAESGGGVR